MQIPESYKLQNAVGYFIPEFPGQTHNFFWRERQALEKMGIETHLISTRHPPKGIVSPSWAKRAVHETCYLTPFTVKDFLCVLKVLLIANPLSWLNCAKIFFSASDLSVNEKIQLLLLIPVAAKLVSLARSQSWSHVHVHSCGNAANIALLAKQFSNVTYSLTLHNPLSVYGGNQKQKWANASFAIVITKAIYGDVTRILGNYLPPDVFIAPMGVDVDKFTRSTPYQPYRGTGSIRIFSCARLNPGKGFNILISAIALLKSRNVDASLVIAGEDDQGGSGYRSVIEQQIAELGLQSQISLLGAVSEEEVISHLELAHLFVLASPEEPLGVAIMEAMAMNVPVIATNAGGVPELISNHIDGILVSPSDPDVLADAISRLRNDREKALRISLASRNKIVQFFSHRESAQVIKIALNKLKQQTFE